MVKANARSLQTLAVGSRVFCPGHGVASVVAVEERAFGDGKQAFYVLELELGRAVKLLLPVGKLSPGGVRALVSAKKARELLTAVKREMAATDVKSDPASRRLRATTYAEALRSGSAERYTEIVRELLPRARVSKLSPGEQQSFNLALAMFIGEVGAALGRPSHEVKTDLYLVPATSSDSTHTRNRAT